MLNGRTVWFDMDGTIANLYSYDNWLELLTREIADPYRNCKPLVQIEALKAEIERLQNKGYSFGIISWASKNGTPDYFAEVLKAKRLWLLDNGLGLLLQDFHVLPYGTPKSCIATGDDILIDDERRNIEEWRNAGMIAYDCGGFMNAVDCLKAIN